MKKNRIHYFMVMIGLLLFATGLYYMKITIVSQGMMMVLPYVCVGLGCGIFGHGMGEILSRRALESNPEMAKQIAIEKNDERNVAIVSRSKAKAYDMMVFVFGALQVAFALMGIDLSALLLLIAAYLFIVGYGIYYRTKLDKEM